MKRPTPPNRESKSGISKIFDELARKADAEPQGDPDHASEKDTNKPKPPSSGRISKLFEEFARKDEGESDEASKS